ncbi:NAD-dependent protein deacetylase [Aliidiomarina soli]|uniref:protein acetyllysine N-acetyltransferase n=1 Tax=Aliidiomarina soli TaxID=1928574 RepID=A0A432WH99_9GAMM|nr:NAD-dependent protein deacetylase [Aliidiomarina soli]RUO33192.1 NAD-dependent protein deacetylase [Aliidiomarina soli]
MHINTIAEAADELFNLLRHQAPLTVLTGAGISTDSGIPDYRDSQGAWKKAPPMQHQEFMSSTTARQRYWARSLHGWPTLYRAKPNSAHTALATWQQQGLIGTIITQNVDGLHQRAGGSQVIDLHGDANAMLCMECGQRSPRLHMHERCLALNTHYAEMTPEVGADGDSHLEGDFSDFLVPDCMACGGILKPDVVYFGDNVPRARVEQAQQALANSRGLLVIGSSLMVFSGFRFARQAHQAQQPLALLNIGKTRADDIADLRLQVHIEPTLRHLIER